ncbi:MAG: Hsp20/alpha crystallin family protein [Chloroflexi bacterium]|nr:Hsp20/alpha crystallin family protein [Chloroflexota bacterium]
MKEPEKNPKKSPHDVSLDLGVGGLFKGLGNILDLLSDMVETTEKSGGEINRTGEFKVKGMGEKARGVYGFTFRTGSGGIPQVQNFGNVRSTQSGPIVVDIREPLVDVFDEEKEIIIAVELPGVGEGEIQIKIQNNVLTLQTSGRLKYAKEILLPAAVKDSSLQKTYNNGILELRLKKI